MSEADDNMGLSPRGKRTAEEVLSSLDFIPYETFHAMQLPDVADKYPDLKICAKHFSQGQWDYDHMRRGWVRTQCPVHLEHPGLRRNK